MKNIVNKAINKINSYFSPYTLYTHAMQPVRARLAEPDKKLTATCYGCMVGRSEFWI